MAFQTIVFFLCQLKHKVGRKAFDISFDLTIKLANFFLIHCRQVSIQYDLLPSNGYYSAFNCFLCQVITISDNLSLVNL